MLLVLVTPTHAIDPTHLICGSAFPALDPIHLICGFASPRISSLQVATTPSRPWIGTSPTWIGAAFAFATPKICLV